MDCRKCKATEKGKCRNMRTQIMGDSRKGQDNDSGRR
jgi:hypothetical protein